MKAAQLDYKDSLASLHLALSLHLNSEVSRTVDNLGKD